MSELYFFVILAISMISVFLAYQLLSRTGLYIILTILTITSYILSFKIAKFFGLNINASIIPFVTLLITIYTIKEVENPKSVINIVALSTAACLATISTLLITNLYIPTVNDLISVNITQMLQDNFFTFISSPFVLIITIYIIAKYYPILRRSLHNKYLSVTFLYVTIGLIYSVIFALMSYIGKISIYEQLYIGISTYIIGLFITIIFLPIFGYLTNKRRVKL